MGLKCHAEIIGVGNGTGSPAVLLFLDARRYLIGCGEGTQRLCGESHVRLARVGAVFASAAAAWDAVGGLPGAALTLAEAGARETRVVGPLGVARLLASTRAFVHGRADIAFRVAEFTTTHRTAFFDDGLVHVAVIPLDRSSIAPVPVPKEESDTERPVKRARRRAEDSAAMAGAIEEEVVGGSDTLVHFCCVAGRARTLVSSPFSVASAPTQDASVESSIVEGTETAHSTVPQQHPELPAGRGESLCFVFELPSSPGKFDVTRANALGVPSGPLRARLVRGETVVTPSGRTVLPHECLGEPELGPVVVFAHCSDPSFIDALVSSTAFAPYYAGCSHGSAVKLIVHTSSRSVLQDPRYSEWTSRFAPTAINCVLGDGCCPPGAALEKALSVQLKLHAVHPQLFPLDCPADPAFVPLTHIGTRPVVLGCRGLRILLGPTKGVSVDESSAWRGPDRARIAAELAANQSLQQHLAALRLLLLPDVLADGSHAPTPSGVFRVVFLGTGASLPSRHRNVSGILLEIGGERKSLLVDCGEASFWQLSRLFGAERAYQLVVEELCAVLITHSHADHHLGLPKFLEIRAKSRCKQPLLVIGPAMLRWWLTEFAMASGQPSLTDPAFVQFVETTRLSAPVLVDALGPNTRVSAAPVQHCPDAFGFVVSRTSGEWSVAVSGDTRPCEEFAVAARGVTLLVHEATFSDALKTEAVAKRHSTIGEAIGVGAMMSARHTVLTHFSQRYSNLLPLAPTDIASAYTHVGAAFDLMCVDSRRLDEMTTILPALAAALEGESDDADDTDVAMQ